MTSTPSPATASAEVQDGFATRCEVQAYRAIRYARADRFGQATLEPFRESLIQTERGPIPPQHPSRLAISMGSQSPNRQDEDCQVLSVFTPSRSGRRPVLVFLHGGAFVTGGGELTWYDGDRLAAEHGLVVVLVTYRLGALGFWLAPGSSGLAPALSDQVAALEWIQTNIDTFGGDPDNVTLAGQSAGAASAVGLTDLGYGGRLFHRTMPMSGPRRIGVTRADMEAHSRKFDEILDADPRRASVEQLLEAQAKQIRADGQPGWRFGAPEQRAPMNVDVLAGWTREDTSAHALLAAGKTPTPGTPLEPFREATRPLIDATLGYAREVAAAGRKAYVYSFDWNGPDTGLGNTHCIDLSFLFGSRAAWEDAPMLVGVDWDEHERMGSALRAQWAAFAASGDPTIPGGPEWAPASSDRTPVTSLA